MSGPLTGALRLHTEIERWPLSSPFRLAGHAFEHIDVLLVRLEKDGHIGTGEAAGIYYRNDDVTSMMKRIAPLRAIIEDGIDRDLLQRLLPPGGARNALDCALWELEAKLVGQAVWQLAGLPPPQPLLTTFGCGADTPQNMAELARSYAQARAIKIKLTGEDIDVDRIRAVRDARPDVWLAVDANQGFTRPFLERLLNVLLDARVSLIEQPFPVGQEALLEGFQSPIPVAADESAQVLSDLDSLVARFNVVNIKLDKSGGLTEALAIARRARELDLDTMVGNMIGTSLAMAPAWLVGQLCRVVDLDGPLFLSSDRSSAVRYVDGFICCDEAVWGGPQVGEGSRAC